MMNGFALLVAVAVLGQTGGTGFGQNAGTGPLATGFAPTASLNDSSQMPQGGGEGWEVGEDGQLQYLVHLTEEDVRAMQTPSGPQNKVAEIVLPIPKTIQGKFARVVLRIDGKPPVRNPSEEMLKSFPLLVQNPPGLQTGSGAGFANIDAPERDRNTAPPVRTTAGSTSPQLSDLAQNKPFGSSGLSNNPLSSAFNSSNPSRDRDAPSTVGGTGSLTSSAINNGSTMNNGGSMAPLNRSDMNRNDASNWNTPTNNGGFNSGLNSLRDPASLSGVSSGLGNYAPMSTPNYNSNGAGGFGSSLSTGVLSPTNSTYQGNGSSYPSSMGNFTGQPGSYVTTPNYLNNGNGSYNGGMTNSGFGNPSPYMGNQTGGYGMNTIGNGASYVPDYRLAGLTNNVQQGPPAVPFPQTASASQSTLPLPGSSSAGRNRPLYNNNWVNSETDTPKQSYLPIFFLLSFVVNLYAGIYLYKLRDRYRALLASVRAGIEP